MAEQNPSKALQHLGAPQSDFLAAEIQQFEAQEFAQIFPRLRKELMDHGMVPKREALYSVFVDGGWVRMLNIPASVRLNVNDNETETVDGHRIIVNIDTLDVVNDSRKALVRDYLLCPQTAIMFELCSEVELTRGEDNSHVWNVTQDSGPLVLAEGDTVSLHEGKFYQDFEYSEMIMTPNNLLAAKHLLGSLSLMSPACEDKVSKVIRHTHTT